MLRSLVLLFWPPLLCVVGCGPADEARDLGGPDMTATAPADLAELDLPASFDATPPCVAQTILDGTSTIAAQGWSVASQTGSASAITTDGVLVDFNTTGLNAQALATKDIGIATGAAYSLEWRLKVIATNGHNQFDAPVAFMASFTPPFGTTTERSQMIYFDAAAIGWADNTQSFAVDTTSAVHMYRLDVSAAGHAEVRVDGTLALIRDGFITTGTVAVGDQTNDVNVDAHFDVYQVRKLCP